MEGTTIVDVNIVQKVALKLTVTSFLIVIRGRFMLI